MLINSLEFIVFVAAVVLIYFLMPKKYKWVVLLIASYIYYFSNSTKLTVFLVITTLSIYLVALKMQKIDKISKNKIDDLKIDSKEELKKEKKIIKNKAKKHKKLFLALGIIINLGILIFLKYSNFLGENLTNLFTIMGLNIKITGINIILPLGISYYTLQAISYIVDVYRGKIEADKNFGRVALFLSFFPQLVEGPIGRYDALANQLYEPHKITYFTLTNGSQLILWGFFKKMVIADRIAIYANEIFNNYSNYSGLFIVFGMIAYTIQIYAEFSGGIDIVRGVAQLFGINLAENFNRPFFSKSIDEFWRRWNITLGTWLKDYVFYPVSFSKIGMKITNFVTSKFKKSNITKIIPVFIPLLCVWLCNGFWHGSGWKYVIYGLYYFTIMILGKIFAPLWDFIVKKFKINIKAESYKLWQIIRTTIFVCFGMLIFRADNLNVAIEMIKSIAHLGNLQKMLSVSAIELAGFKVYDLIITMIGVSIIFFTSLYRERGHSIRKKLSEQNLLFRWIVFYILIFSIIIFGIYGEGFNPQSFIYGQF